MPVYQTSLTSSQTFQYTSSKSLIGPYTLSNGWIVVGVPLTSGNNEIFVSQDGGASFYSHCVIGSLRYGTFHVTGTKLIQGALYYIDLATVAAGTPSVVQWTYVSIGYNADAWDLCFVSSSGKIYFDYTQWDGDGNVVADGIAMGTIGGSWSNSAFAYPSGESAEYGGYIYILSLINTVGVYRYDPNTNTKVLLSTPLPTSAVSSFAFHYSPADNLLYAIGASGNLIGQPVRLFIYTFDGANWTIRYDNSSIVPSAYFRIRSFIDTSGKLIVFMGGGASSGDSNLYYGEFTNTGTTFSGFTSLGPTQSTQSFTYTNSIAGAAQFNNGAYYGKYSGVAWLSTTNPSHQVNFWVNKANTAPNVPVITSITGDNYYSTKFFYNGNSAIGITVTVSDSDVDTLIKCQVAGSYNDFAAWHFQQFVDINVGSGGSFTLTLPCSGFVESDHWSFAIQVQDSNGEWSPWAYTSNSGGYMIIDKTPPTYSNPNAGSSPVNQAYGATHQVSIDVADILSGAHLVAVYYTPPGGIMLGLDARSVSSSGSTITVYVPVSLEGTYYVYLYVQDYAGNNCSTYPITLSFIVDRSGPTIAGITSTSYTHQAIQRMSITGVSDANGISHVDAYILNVDGVTWTGPMTATDAGSGTWYYDFDASYQGDATHTVRFWAYDTAGNGNFADSAICYDTTAPTIASVQGYSYTNLNTGTRRVWAYGVSDSGSGLYAVYCNYKLPDGTQVNGVQCTLFPGSDYYVDIPLSAEGEYAINFYAQDRAGNWGPTVTAWTYFFVDTKKASDPNPGAVWGQTQATLTWSGFADPSPSSGYDHTAITLGEWDGTNWAGGAPNIYNGLSIADSSVSQKVATGLSPGKRYRYTVVYNDKAGNQSAYTWHEFVTKRKIGEQRVTTSSGTVSLPIYDPASGVVGSTALRGETASGAGCFELVATNDTNASPLRVKTAQGIMSVSKFGGA